MNRAFVRDIQIYTARSAVTASAARGQGAPGLVAAARIHLASVTLAQFGTSSERRFRGALDRHTDSLAAALPRKGRSWGVARKLLNIFLRNAFYTTYLRDAFDLAVAEDWFEVPLDGIVAKRVRADLHALRLPRWTGVRNLTPALSHTYQDACRQLARARGVAPVHLDALFWGTRDDTESAHCQGE